MSALIKYSWSMILLGALTEETNTFNGVVVKYSEPPEARKPKRRWRFYVFKVTIIYIRYIDQLLDDVPVLIFNR